MSGIVRANNAGQSGAVSNIETIDSDDYVNASIDNAHLADDAVDSDELAAGAVDTAHIADNNVTAAKIFDLARGSVLVGNASAATAELTIGSNTQVLASDGTDIAWAAVVSAGAAVSGIVELATAAETTTGTDAGRAVTPDGMAGSVVFGTRYVQMVVVDFATDIAEGNGKFYLHIPAGLHGMNLIEVHAKVVTVGDGSTVSVQVHNLTDTTDMLSTNVTIDDGELDSKDAAAAVAIDTGEDDIVTNDVLRIDVDGNGGDTTIAKGLIVTLGFRLP